nr:DNA polymerase III subunit gamma/tau [Prolixibacteraceae bacterium]
PKHALFILATTEKHKIIPTILSRCQIFDFNRINHADIVAYLNFVAGQEKVEIEESGVNVMAHKADGAMRDALSIFDQIVSFSGNKISYQDVIENLNVLDYDYYFRLTSHCLQGEITEVLTLFNEILIKGFDGYHFVGGLGAHFRDLLISKDPATVQLLEVGGEIRDKYKAQASLCSVEFLYKSIEIATDCDINYKTSQNKRLLVELALIKIAQLGQKKK